jgi:hypothetical protein
MPAGRPTDYREEYVKDAEKLAALGATDIEIADFFEVDVRTIYRWKHNYEKFCQALNIGKAKADERVVNSLYQKAIRFTRLSVPRSHQTPQPPSSGLRTAAQVTGEKRLK